MYARRPGVKIAFMAQEICFMVRLYSKILGDAREMDDTSSRPQTGSRLHKLKFRTRLRRLAFCTRICCGMWHAEGYLVADCR